MKAKLLLHIPWLTLLILIGFYFGKNLTNYYAIGTHDGNYNLVRSLVASELLKAGVFPLRWSATLNQFCGAAIFNFFYPLLSYLLALLHNLTKIDLPVLFTHLVATTFILSPLGFYLFALQISHKKLVAFSSAIFYAIAPYHFVNAYVRGTPESLAYALIPWVFALTIIFFRTQKRIYFLLSSLLGGLFLISHNLVALYFFPLLILTAIYQGIIKHKPLSSIFLILSWIGLSAFFWFPALIEQQFVHLSDKVVVNPLENLISLSQLIYSKWGYFYFSSSPQNPFPFGINLSLGLAQVLILVLATASFIYKPKSFPKLYLPLLLFTFLILFMIISPSRFIWASVPQLNLLQFPWRLLGLTLFLVATLSTFLLSHFPFPKLLLPTCLFLIVLTLFANRNHHYPTPVMDVSLYKNLNSLEQRYTSTTIADEITSIDSPSACTSSEPFVSGKLIQGSSAQITEAEHRIVYSSSKDTTHDLTLRLDYYPNIYSFSVNGIPYPHENKNGRILIKNVNSKKELNQITYTITQTPLQKFSNLITLTTIIALIIFLLHPILPLPLKPKNETAHK